MLFRSGSLTITGRFLVIPPESKNHKVSGSITIDRDCTLYTVLPHMHMLGKSIKVTMFPPGSIKGQLLLDIPEWDYNWQETYYLAEPLKAKAGTKFEVEAIFDNSAANPNNPFSPPKFVKMGQETTDEMCFVFLGATSDQGGRIRGSARPKKAKVE